MIIWGSYNDPCFAAEKSEACRGNYVSQSPKAEQRFKCKTV